MNRGDNSRVKSGRNLKHFRPDAFHVPREHLANILLIVNNQNLGLFHSKALRVSEDITLTFQEITRFNYTIVLIDFDRSFANSEHLPLERPPIKSFQPQSPITQLSAAFILGKREIFSQVGDFLLDFVSHNNIMRIWLRSLKKW
jgi:hypothetical protein